MEFGFDVFYCTMCHVCKNTANLHEAMKFCSVCKLVQYCCSSHQKEDWPNHKQFCKAIKKINDEINTKHIFEKANLGEQDRQNWNNLRAFVMNFAKKILKRPLTCIETQMLLFPPVCNVCLCYKQNEMISCYSCNTVLYCSPEHQKCDEKHKDVCKLLFLSCKIDLQRFFLQNDKAYNFRMLNDIKPKIPKKFPLNMERFFNTNGKNLSTEELLLTEPLSYTLTLAYVISCVSMLAKDCLTVHIIGADTMELLSLKTLPVMFNFMPNLSYLKIVLIGPNLPENIPVPTQIHDKCSLHLVSNVFYHDYINGSHNGSTPTVAETRPNVIAVFNCGFCEFVDEPEKDNWKNSLPCILSFPNSTVILTSYTQQESVSDLKRLSQVKEEDNCYDVLMESKLNPFGSCYPHRDWEVQNEAVFYVNKFLSVLKTK